MINFYYKNHLINKKLDQFFLQNQSIIKNIIKIFHPKNDEIVVEIGPGFGELTQHILHSVKHLTVIEYDKNLSKKLHNTYNSCANLKIINKDILKINFFKLYNFKKIRFIGNLPYSISISILNHLFKYIPIIQDMHFMFQKEVAQRLSASPNNKKYGRLSIFTQYYCKIFSKLKIPKYSFIPIPKIDSEFVSLYPHTNSPYPKINIKMLSYITKLAFSQRRKIIKNSLSKLFDNNNKILSSINIDEKLRAENLSVQQYCQLTQILSKHINSSNYHLFF